MQTTGEQLRAIIAEMEKREWLYTRPVDAGDDVPSDAAYSEVMRYCGQANPAFGDLVAAYERRFTSREILVTMAAWPSTGIRIHSKALLSAVRLLEAVQAYQQAPMGSAAEARALEMARNALALSDEALFAEAAGAHV